MRGSFGSTEYYIVTMRAKDLTEKLTIPRDIEGWDDMSLEERYQRDINYNRVKRQMAPYLVDDDDRFFGSFIVSVLNAADLEFEPITNIYKGSVPNLYRSAATAFGFLTLHGGEVLVPLDGQHRLAALQFAITGKDEKQLPIPGLESKTEVADDMCTVMLMKHDPLRSRKIFNKVNRYAKKTTKAENLITADDDVVAVIVREHIIGVENVIPDSLVNARSNTLTAKASEFTTLSTLYEATKYLLEDTHVKINTETLPPKHTIQVMTTEAKNFWEKICSDVELFSNALHDPSESGDAKRQEIRRDFVLGKPVTQWALIQAVVRLRTPHPTTGERVSLDEGCRRVNQLNWSVSDPRWQHVLMNGDKVLAGRSAANFASRVIAYWLGQDLSDTEMNELEDRYKSQGGRHLAAPIELT
ncbi:MAG: DGQHR domain-containing protein [bacterium]|nr:DGQHR domain-containing protein [bacterium]MCY3952195.1 DGQHR domain-containing protein [bacterium]